MTNPILFPIYSRQDAARVQSVIHALRAAGIEVWTEAEQLQPGSNFQDQIIEAINAAAAAIVFVSASLEQSEWTKSEISSFHATRKPILPVAIEHIEHTKSVPFVLQLIQPVDLIRSGSSIPPEALEQIRSFVARLPSVPERPRSKKTQEDVRQVAATLASAVRKPSPAQRRSEFPPKSVFIVHGHDDGLLKDVESYLGGLGVESIVLRRIGGPAQSLFQKFMQWGTETRFALVLLAADDFGVSRTQYDAEGAGIHALQFRARQNVILELGFFYGHLGWENVFVLFKKPDKVFPNFERPSDLDGVVFDMVEESGEWKTFLKGKLQEAGFRMN